MDDATVMSIPGAQLVGYICDIVPKYPKDDLLSKSLML